MPRPLVREWEVAAPQFHDWDWARRATFDRAFHRTKPSGGQHRKGARSLVEMTAFLTTDYLGYLNFRHLDGVNDSILLRIWAYIQSRSRIDINTSHGRICRITPMLKHRDFPFHAWKLLSNRLLQGSQEKTLGLWKFRREVDYPTSPLQTYTEPLVSQTFDFIAHLSINDSRRRFGTSELLALADLKNLGVLEITESFSASEPRYPEVCDRLVKGWALKPNPFPLLRILRLWGYGPVTQLAVQLASLFPSLAIFDVVGADQDWEEVDTVSTSCGWAFLETDFTSAAPLSQYLRLFAAVHGLKPGEIDSYGIETAVENSLDDDGEVVEVFPRKTPSVVEATQLKRQVMDSEVDDQRASPSTRGKSIFEPSAFWLYSLVGALTMDKDMIKQGLVLDTRAQLGRAPLPARPLASICLGPTVKFRPYQSPRGNLKMIRSMSRFILVRRTPPCTIRGESRERPPVPRNQEARPAQKPKARKRQKLQDVLTSFHEAA